MPLYEKQFTKPYPDGYVDKPQKTTPVTAGILNMQDNTLLSIENFLASDEVNFKNQMTVGTRNQNIIQGNYTLTAGTYNVATGEGATALGMACFASGNQSHAEGNGNMASSHYSHAEGKDTVASGLQSHAEGRKSKASGESSHAEGAGTIAESANSHAEGEATKASGISGAHAEGAMSIASGTSAHAEGMDTKSNGNYSHSEGEGTLSSGVGQHVQGRYNAEDSENKYAHIVGGGTSRERRNIHTIDWQGNAWYAGDITNGNGVSLDGLMALVGTTGQLRTIVETLPETDISTDTIYMVPKESGRENDIYNEYINVDGTPEGWEFIGNSAIDLSNYYTRDQVDQMLAGYVPAETGKELSSNDYTDADLEIVENIRNMTAAGALAILNETEGEA